MSDLIIPTLSVVVITNIILGLIAVSRGIKSFADIIFSFITLTLVIWSIAIICFYSASYQSLTNWISITHSSALFISYFFLIFSLNFPQKIPKSKWVVIIATVLLICLTYFIFLSNYIIGDTHGITYQLGSGYVYYAVVLTLYFFVGFIFLFVQHKKTKDSVQQKQIQYVLMGYLISSILAIIPDLILPYFKIYQYTWLGPLFAFILIASLFIAMLKYKLFQIKIILTEVVSIVIIIALLMELFFVSSITELFLKTFVLIIITFFSYLLIRGVYREISQRERIEKLAIDLEQANVRLTDLNKQKSEFVSFATHQIRAPLTAMKGYASLILEGDMGEIGPEAQKAVSRIYESTNTLTSIVEDYLNVTRIELGTMKFSFEIVDLKLMVEDVIDELKPTIVKSELKFSFDNHNPSADYRIMADRDKLKQVAVNLVDNALKYTTSGFITVSLACDSSKRLITFAVKDSGVGISLETMPLLFRKFSRADNANKANIKGTGLGLYVAREIITAHHGIIRAESLGEGKGATFIVELEPYAKV